MPADSGAVPDIYRMDKNIEKEIILIINRGKYKVCHRDKEIINTEIERNIYVHIYRERERERERTRKI